jgi:hypothetical protein
MIVECKGIEYPVKICDCGRGNGLDVTKMHSEQVNSFDSEVVEVERCSICGNEYLFVMLHEGEYETGTYMKLIK